MNSLLRRPRAYGGVVHLSVQRSLVDSKNNHAINPYKTTFQRKWLRGPNRAQHRDFIVSAFGAAFGQQSGARLTAKRHVLLAPRRCCRLCPSRNVSAPQQRVRYPLLLLLSTPQLHCQHPATHILYITCRQFYRPASERTLVSLCPRTLKNHGNLTGISRLTARSSASIVNVLASVQDLKLNSPGRCGFGTINNTNTQPFKMLSSLIQKAQSLILEPPPTPTSSGSKPSKAQQFRLQFRLPQNQTLIQEIPCELSLATGEHYSGKLYLSEAFLCYSTTTSSSSAAPASPGFTIPLCGIRRVERLHSRSYIFALAVTTWHNDLKLTLQFNGFKPHSERFCDALKRGLRAQMGEMKHLRNLLDTCYSEYHLAGSDRKSSGIDGSSKREKGDPPDAGLGMMFKYPGDARKLRDRSKMRLWAEYLRGAMIWMNSV